MMGMLALLAMLFNSASTWGLGLVLETRQAEPGDRSYLNLSVQDVHDIGNLSFELSYDWENLELLEVRPGPLMTDLGDKLLSAMNPEEFPDREGRFKFGMVVAEGFGGSGHLMSLVFGISDSAKGLVEVRFVRASAADTSLADVEVEAVSGGFLLPVSVSEEEVAVPVSAALLPNFPNPFNSGTWIPFQVPEDCEVEVRIYDILGQVVRKIELGRVTGGYYVSAGRAVYWDGRDGRGRELGSGVYLVRLKAGEFVCVRKAVLLK